MIMAKKLTVFTPTYNRKELLKRVHDSLLRQTSDDFVWLVVDDGSTDDTKSLVDKWIQEGKIDIRYKYCENGGKMRAHNRGVELCDTPYFVCLDSDDYFVDSAVSDLIEAYENALKEFEISDERIEDNNKELETADVRKENINKELKTADVRNENIKRDMFGKSLAGRNTLAGIVAHKGKSETKLLTECDFPKGENTFTGLYEMYLNGFRGETTLMFRTDILKQFPFPEIESEKYVPEDYIYDKIDHVCVLSVLDRIITVCEIVSEGYTDSVAKLKSENKRAWQMYYEQRAQITPFSVLKLKHLGFTALYCEKCDMPMSKEMFNAPERFVGFVLKIVLKIMGKS